MIIITSKIKPEELVLRVDKFLLYNRVTVWHPQMKKFFYKTYEVTTDNYQGTDFFLDKAAVFFNSKLNEMVKFIEGRII